MEHSKFIVSSRKEEPICSQRVKENVEVKIKQTKIEPDHEI